MILNSGARTDIPAFYSSWFMNRLDEKFVLVRNPYYPEQITRYTLTPDVVDVLVFCTKNPAPMLTHIAQQPLASFRQYWFVTITPYGTDLEPYVPPSEQVISSFKQLADSLETLHSSNPLLHTDGKHCVCWRYDPVFITDTYSLSFHIDSFNHIARELSGYTNECVISFIDLYAKTKRNFPEAREVTAEERTVLAEAFGRTGSECGIRIKTCAEPFDLRAYGIQQSGCLTGTLVEKLINCSGQHFSIAVPAAEPLRKSCGCIPSRDIGMYNTCPHGCRYCYANYNRATVLKNYGLHDDSSPLLIGHVQDGDIIKNAEQHSWIHDKTTTDIQPELW
jgi:PAS domain-containing protein